MSNSNFKKPPLTEKEKEKKAEEFLSFLERKEIDSRKPPQQNFGTQQNRRDLSNVTRRWCTIS